MNTIKFAQCMKQNMEFKGLTTETLAALTGIPITRLKEYESGEFKARSDEIYAIGKALDVPPAILMHGGGTIII